MSDEKNNKKISRSIRLKKYENAYQSYLTKLSFENTKGLVKDTSKGKTKCASPNRRKPDKSPRRKPVSSPRRKIKRVEKSPTQTIPKSSKKELNSYQLFVQDESKKTRYGGMSGKDRMLLISQAWKKRKKHD